VQAAAADFEADAIDGEDPDDVQGPVPLADQPTDTDPGSPAKVAVLEERARLCVALFHPLDSDGPAALPRDPRELLDFLRPRRRVWGRRGRLRMDGRPLRRDNE
jgi:hypothetical protein